MNIGDKVEFYINELYTNDKKFMKGIITNIREGRFLTTYSVFSENKIYSLEKHELKCKGRA